MGNNQAYSDWESVAIATYDKGVLDKDLLGAFMEMHRDSDIDLGGSQDLVAKDGLSVEEVVIKVFGCEVPKYPELPKDHKKWTEADQALNDAYFDKRYELFREITKKFGW